jgi:hypothetical protein
MCLVYVQETSLQFVCSLHPCKWEGSSITSLVLSHEMHMYFTYLLEKGEVAGQCTTQIEMKVLDFNFSCSWHQKLKCALRESHSLLWMVTLSIKSRHP